MGGYWQVFKHFMISILPNKMLHMTDIICTEAILFGQEASK